MRYLGLILYFFSKNINTRHIFTRKVSKKLDSIFQVSLRMLGSRIGNESFIRKPDIIIGPYNITIGDRTIVGPGAELYGYAKISIGNDVEIGSQLIIQTSEHSYSDKSRPLGKQESFFRDVIISDDVYIGSRVTVLSGVTVCSRVIIGAGAVVTKDIIKSGIYAGVPAKLIKEIDNSLQI